EYMKQEGEHAIMKKGANQDPTVGKRPDLQALSFGSAVDDFNAAFFDKMADFDSDRRSGSAARFEPFFGCLPDQAPLEAPSSQPDQAPASEFFFSCNQDQELAGAAASQPDQIPLDILRDANEGPGGSPPVLAQGSRAGGVEVFASVDFGGAQKEEIQSFLSQVRNMTKRQLQRAFPASLPSDGRGIACPFCPELRWLRGSVPRLCRRVDARHCAKQQAAKRIAGGLRFGGANFTAAGTKLLRVMAALFDRDRMVRRVRRDYLARSAAMLGAVCGDVQAFNDRRVVLLLDANVVSFARATVVSSNPAQYLRIGCTCVTRAFCEMCYAEFLLCGFASQEVRARIVLHYLRMKCDLAERIPYAQEMFWRALVEKADYREKAAVREAAAIPDAEAVRRIVTVRGRTGAMVCCVGTKSESGEDIARELAQHVPADCLAQVRTVATDSPGPELLAQLKAVMPNLEFLVLDLVHIAFSFESAQGRAKTSAGQTLRTIQAKWNKVDGRVQLPQPSGAAQMSKRALVARDWIAKCSMAPDAAANRLQDLDGSAPYYSVEDYIEDLAALCAAFPVEVRRKPSVKVGPVHVALWRATSPQRLSYVLNNQRRLLLVPEEQRAQLSSGTAAVEALNAEIIYRFRFHGLFYQSALLLTIKAFGDLKLPAHNSAEHCPTLSQTGQRTVALHALSVFRLLDDEWAAARAADAPLVARRLEHKGRIRAARAKSKGEGEAVDLTGSLGALLDLGDSEAPAGDPASQGAAQRLSQAAPRARAVGPPSEVFEGRKRFPRAQESKAVFEKCEVELPQVMSDVVRNAKRFQRVPREGIRFENRRVEKGIMEKYADWPEEYMSVDGRVRFFDPNSGGWRAYTGLFPEGMYAHFRLFMNRLEGMFRCVGKDVRRDANGALEKMDAIIKSSDGDGIEQKAKNAFQMFEHFSLWNKGSGDQEEAVADVDEPGGPPQQRAPAGGEGGDGRPSRDGDEDEGPKAKKLKMPWHIDVAVCIRSFGKKLASELMQGGSVVKNFTEWCGTSVTPARGVCYLDRAVKQDVPMMTADGVVVQPLVVVDGMPTPKDFFFFCMDSSLVPATHEDGGAEDEGPERPLDDPVLMAATDDANKFLSSTFWCNFEALNAIRSAPAMAKGGLHVLQCYIFLGAGGCGLSLFTDPIATSMGDELHKYFNPFVFYDDEELRKCVELLAGGCVYSGQERPQGSKKKLLLHLWRKFLSGEGLRGRLPYAVLTRMVRLIGWVKLEVNSMLAFSDLTEQEFESIMRRSCVIKIAARLFDKQYLGAHFPEHEEYGTFARDPSFTRKFQTSQCAAAWNRTQHVFEASNGEQQCQDFIVQYSRGGEDLGVTERYMRRACSLGAPSVSDNQSLLAGVVVEVDADEFSLQAPTSASAKEREFAVALLRETCDRGLEAMALSYFNQRSRRIEGSSNNRQQLWDDLPCSGLWKLQATKAQHRDGASVVPVFPFKYTMDDLFGAAAATPQNPGVLPEAIDVKNAKKKLVDNVAYMQNAELAIEALQRLLAARAPGHPMKRVKRPAAAQEPREDEGGGAEGRGRRSNAQKEEESAIRKRIEKLDAVALGRVSSDAAEPGAEKRRQLAGKVAPSHVHTVRVQYVMSRPWVSREHATAGDFPAAQNMPQYLQMIAFPQTVGLDQVAACLTFSEQLLQHLRLAEDVKAAFAPELVLLKELRQGRDGVCLRELGPPGALGKDVILMAIHGKKELPHATLLGPDCEEFLKKLKRLSWFLRWAAASAMPEQYAALKDDPSVTWVEGNCFAHFWQMAESYVAMHICDFARQRPFKHLAKAYDGARIDTGRVAAEKARLAVEEQGAETQSDAEVFALAASRYVAQQPLAFVVRLREKRHLPFYNLIRNCEYSDAPIEPSLVPAQDLSSVLITVPTALGDYGTLALAQQLMQLAREHAERDLSGVAYLEAKSILTIKELIPTAALPDEGEGTWLMRLHDEGTVPRCAVVFCDDELAAVIVYLAMEKFTFSSRKAFKDMLLRSVDRHWQFFFQMTEQGPLGGPQGASAPLEALLKMT
ncbi:unnamed protein product, partial [Prorocentrum cordatum]